MQFGALLAEVHFDDFLGVVPRASGVGHEDGLEQTEERDANQVTDEEIRVEERQREREAEHHDEDVPHALLRIDGADADDFLAVLFRGGGGVEFYVLLDIDHRAIRAGDDRLAGSAGEPVNHRAAHDEAKDDLRLHDGELVHHITKHVFEQHDDAEHHRGRADNGGTNEHGLGRGLEGVARAVALFQLILGVFKVCVETEVAFDFFLDAFAAFNLAQLKDRLGVVGDRAVAVHGNRHRPHAEEAEGHEAEREDRRGEQEFRRHEREERRILGKEIRGGHQHHDAQPHPEGRVVAGHEARQDVQRRAAVPGAVGHFLDVPGVGANEYLGEFGN